MQEFAIGYEQLIHIQAIPMSSNDHKTLGIDGVYWQYWDSVPDKPAQFLSDSGYHPGPMEIPIVKVLGKGDLDNPNSYRGITLLSTQISYQGNCKQMGYCSCTFNSRGVPKAQVNRIYNWEITKGNQGCTQCKGFTISMSR